MLGYAVISGLAYARIYYIPPRNLNIVFRLLFVKQPPPQAPRSQCWEGALGDPVFFVVFFVCLHCHDKPRFNIEIGGRGGTQVKHEFPLSMYLTKTFFEELATFMTSTV